VAPGRGKIPVPRTTWKVRGPLRLVGDHQDVTMPAEYARGFIVEVPIMRHGPMAGRIAMHTKMRTELQNPDLSGTEGGIAPP
jgi:hypothetical protein